MDNEKDVSAGEEILSKLTSFESVSLYGCCAGVGVGAFGGMDVGSGGV